MSNCQDCVASNEVALTDRGIAKEIVSLNDRTIGAVFLGDDAERYIRGQRLKDGFDGLLGHILD